MTPCPLPSILHPRPHGALPLAGSRIAWWTGLRDGAGREAPASGLPRDVQDRLSAPRAALCGLSLDRPRVMGILNVTPDSFSDGGVHATLETAVARAREMAADADIIDIGGESTRPGARAIAQEDEIARTAPVIRAIRAAGLTVPISIDTRKAAVAEAALDAGADMVNDVTALRYDPAMAPLVAERGVPVCLMHSVADPETMMAHARYGDVVAEVMAHLALRIDAAVAAGIARDRIVIDPGIGFGKTLDHNLEVLNAMPAFHALGPALLVGASRKRFIGTLGRAAEPRDRMAGSVAVALHAAAQGVQVLRVHDTAATRQALRLQAALAGDQEATDGA